MNKLYFTIGIAILIAYAVSVNIYLLIMAYRISDDIKRNGQRMDSDVFSSLSWNTNFWNEAAALCENSKLLKVLDLRMPLFVIWCVMVGIFFDLNILSL